MTRRSFESALYDHRWLLAAIAVGVGLRVAAIALLPHESLAGDEQVYYGSALDLLAGREVDSFPFRAPLYIYFCAALLELAGPGPNAIRFAQVGLEALTIVGIHLLASRTLGSRTAAWAAWLYALYPDFIAFSHYLWSETIGLLLLTWGLLALVQLRDHPRSSWALLAGLVWGVASLNKPASLYLTLPLFSWVAYSIEAPARRAAPALAAIGIATAVLVILPWSVHSSLKFDRAMLVSTTGDYNLRIGNNNYEPPHYDYPNHGSQTHIEGRFRDRKIGLVQWIAEDPQRFARRTLQKMRDLWSPTSFVIRHIYWNRYGSVERMSPTLRVAVVYGLIAFTMAALLVAVVGLFASRRRHPFVFGLTVAYVVPYLAMISLTIGLTRYRLPLMVFALLYAGYGLAERRELGSELRSPGAAVPVLATTATLAALWWGSVPELLRAVH